MKHGFVIAVYRYRRCLQYVRARVRACVRARACLCVCHRQSTWNGKPWLVRYAHGVGANSFMLKSEYDIARRNRMDDKLS